MLFVRMYTVHKTIKFQSIYLFIISFSSCETYLNIVFPASHRKAPTNSAWQYLLRGGEVTARCWLLSGATHASCMSMLCYISISLVVVLSILC